VPLGYAHSYSYRNSEGNPDSNAHPHDNPNSYGHGTTYRDSYRYTDTVANRHANPDFDSHGYAGPDHTQRAWLQSAGFTDGGPLMGRGDFKQH
jgi:hypothetical protein